MGKKIFDLLRSILIIYIMLRLGKLIAHFVPLGVPASIWGLLLLFFCLLLRIVHLNWIHLGATLLVRYMAILFIPVSVGIIKYSDLLLEQAQSLLIPNIISTCLTLVMVGFLSDYLFSRSSFKHLRKKVIKRRAKQ